MKEPRMIVNWIWIKKGGLLLEREDIILNYKEEIYSQKCKMSLLKVNSLLSNFNPIMIIS